MMTRYQQRSQSSIPMLSFILGCDDLRCFSCSFWVETMNFLPLSSHKRTYVRTYSPCKTFPFFFFHLTGASLLQEWVFWPFDHHTSTLSFQKLLLLLPKLSDMMGGSRCMHAVYARRCVYTYAHTKTGRVSFAKIIAADFAATSLKAYIPSFW